MRSGLRPIAISCNKSTYCSPFAALVDARAPSESAFGASDALKKGGSMQKMNVGELAFYEVRRSSSKGITGIGARYSRLKCSPMSGSISALVCCLSAPTRREEASERQVNEECSQLWVLDDARSRAAY